MAVLILGGLVSSPLLTLFVLPVLYGWIVGHGGSDKRHAEA